MTALSNSLRQQGTCPVCHASWLTIEEILETEPLTGSFNLDMALTIIMNCRVCQTRFGGQLDIIKKLFQARRLEKQGIEVKAYYKEGNNGEQHQES